MIGKKNTKRFHLFAALSAGCIIYVVVFEVLQRERSKVIRPKIIQFLALVVGFTTMMTIDLLSKEKKLSLGTLLFKV